uniref:NB-ARC domain-containing protein n=1 Tax=Triticum urartu TaxID=4572 RepID=A0A8R7TQ26_TRIUA
MYGRYLIIIDDLWDVSAWEFIKCAFPENDLASRVIVTTRSLKVATACCSPHSEYILQMKPLSNEDSRMLFFGRIFGSEDICPNHLRDVSVEILNKCGGLPLAIITIAGLLASEGPKEEEWEHVRNSLGSMSGTKLTLNGMRQILNLSYKDLPSHLKTCLLYLAMYPEDYTIKRSNLERQWMAEGFISKENGQDVEKNARNYFNELVNRSLVQPVWFDGGGAVTACKVHDMMLDLILLKCKEENFLSIVDGSEAITEEEYKVRRLSLRLNDSDNGILLGNISLSQVRSVMIFGDSGKIPPLSKFKFLRVLFVENHRTMDLTGMNELYQLRYIMIGSRLQLPRQIRGLQQLETLDIQNSRSIPSDIILLPHLSHLDIGYACKLPDGIGNMKSLRFLSKFNLNFRRNSLDNYKGLGELTNMRILSLYGNLDGQDASITGMDVLCCSLRKLCRLESLFINNFQGSKDGLSLPCSLQRLHSGVTPWYSCWFSRVPNCTRELHNLHELHLQVDELLDDGVGILGGLPSLIDLDLHVRRSPKQMIIINGRGTFPVLKSFRMSLSRASYLIFKSGAMPTVQRLRLNFNFHVQMQNGAWPAGIEHLAALEELSAHISYVKATESQKSCAESDFRSIVNRHPDNPLTVVRWGGDFMDD